MLNVPFYLLSHLAWITINKYWMNVMTILLTATDINQAIVIHCVQYSMIHKYCLITWPIRNFMPSDRWQKFGVYRTFLDMLVPDSTSTNIVLCYCNEKFAEIWLFNKNTLKKIRIVDSVRDDDDLWWFWPPQC